MNEQGDATKSGSRRKFLWSAGVAASGVAAIGANGAPSGQAPGLESATPAAARLRGRSRFGTVARPGTNADISDESAASTARAAVRRTPFVRRHQPKCT